MANPRKVEWGTAPVLIKSTQKPGIIKVRASVVHQGVQALLDGEISFESIASSMPFVYDEIPKKSIGFIELNSEKDTELIQELRLKLEQEKKMNGENLKKVQEQQEEFEGLNKKKK